jgi:hypothetical protein
VFIPKIIIGTIAVILFVGGAVFILGRWSLDTSCEVTSESDRAAYDAANRFGLQAHQLIQAHDYRKASNVLDIAISELGDVYMLPSSLDDTGMMLNSVSGPQSQSSARVTAETKLSVLNARLKMFRLKQSCADKSD